MKRMGIVRYRPVGTVPEGDPAAFDGWYQDAVVAKVVYRRMVEKYPDWICALVIEDESHFPP